MERARTRNQGFERSLTSNLIKSLESLLRVPSGNLYCLTRKITLAIFLHAVAVCPLRMHLSETPTSPGRLRIRNSPKPFQPRGTIRRQFRASRTPRSQLFPTWTSSAAVKLILNRARESPPSAVVHNAAVSRQERKCHCSPQRSTLNGCPSVWHWWMNSSGEAVLNSNMSK